MVDSLFLFSDGKFIRTGKPIISPNNRSFRYGDGFFETIKWFSGKILLEQYHMERLFHSLEILKFKPPNYFTPDYITQAIHALVQKNQHNLLARVRVTIYRGDGGIYDEQNHFPHILIQTWDLNESNNRLNENGLEIGLFPKAIKSADHFSMIKSNNYLPYVMAALWAKEQKLNDAVLLNSNGHIADTTIANIFIITNGIIKTPPITDGPVAGVMRKHVISQLRKHEFDVLETSISALDLEQASEIFLTNAIYGIKWVKKLGETHYSNSLTLHICTKTVDFFPVF
ncbi:MAG: aminotransferase class IV [Sphingobacteriia bacterium]|jgi:branched-chain amino acid aminotransferase